MLILLHASGGSCQKMLELAKRFELPQTAILSLSGPLLLIGFGGWTWAEVKKKKIIVFLSFKKLFLFHFIVLFQDC